jgi:uncharacterized integral membrane protein (TIGR00698 family)
MAGRGKLARKEGSVRRTPWLRAETVAAAARLPRGLAVTLVIAGAAAFLAQSHGGPVVLYALLIGMACGFLSDDPRLAPGITFAAQAVLRAGVALLGARITLEQVAGVGLAMMLAVAASVFATIALGVVLARWLRLPASFGVLTAGATAICGASAAAALAAVLPRRPGSDRDTAFTIIGVTALSTIAMVLYPALARQLGLGEVEIGIFLGATIHDVAQVVGAGYSVSPLAGDKATIVKLYRVALLLPVVLVVAWTVRAAARREAATKPAAAVALTEAAGSLETPSVSGKALVPGFLLAFAALVFVGSLGLIPAPVVGVLSATSRWLIVTAIAAVGLRTSLRSFLEVGQPAIGLLLSTTVFLAALVLGMIALLR